MQHDKIALSVKLLGVDLPLLQACRGVLLVVTPMAYFECLG